MAESKYRATLSRGRKSWCVIFRHPLRPAGDGRPGLRVRRGLGIEDKASAQVLVDQLNQLLADETFWRLSARESAARKFDQKVVDAFFDEIEFKTQDPGTVRDEVIYLPGPKDGYVRVLLVGPTGAGKTTLLRQLIGSHPKTDRFPSTSTAKTTIFDTEIVLDVAPYRCVVSFLSRDRVRSYIEECVISAVSAAAESCSEDIVLRRLLEHSEQRFRLSYLIGVLPEEHSANTEEVLQDELDFEDNPDQSQGQELSDIPEHERVHNAAILEEFLNRINRLAIEVRSDLAQQLEVDPANLKPEDRDAFLAMVEDMLFDHDDAQQLIEDILAEVESKFALLSEGSYERDDTDWPKSWAFETGSRQEFIKTINRFSSNYAPHFGRLLAPLVQGLRVAGPFIPSWHALGSDIPRLVFIDGEGLGHTPASSASLPTAVTKRYDAADVILLIDSATQPMQAAAQAVLRSAASSGHDTKTVIVFTHFDQVVGDNLPGVTARRNHVLASLENAIDSVDSTIGSGVGRRLQRILAARIFFVSRIQEALAPTAHQTRRELDRLLNFIEAARVPKDVQSAIPVYDLTNLVLRTRSAAEQFHEHWNARLGFDYKTDVPTEHWTRVKALSRRFANQWEDQFDTLRPVADMIKFQSERFAEFISTPHDWDPLNAPDEVKEMVAGKVAQEFYSRLHTLISERFTHDHLNEWVSAYGYRGTGSTRLRARDIRGIYESASPIPLETPAPDASSFLDAIRHLFREAALAAGGRVVG